MLAAPLPRPHAESAARSHLSPPRPLAMVDTPRQLDSRSLFAGAQEVRIAHLGQEYRLRQTRNGKLILTK